MVRRTREEPNNMLKLRCAIVNETFDEVFAKYATKEKTKRFAKKT
jgi:hypothetical protein